ncbi:MAG: glucose-6-phosphate dehydrogenase [Robiginitomaculum sp.]|nr:glucose-6-phosphate dehydrogenase [Robiginitomaculum sp.]MDQ7077045.1 glucose-6-phosphate dehydrogenase [Robiginitomaculum sp.]
MNNTQASIGSKLLPVDPFDIVVFGATGDLALRKLLPALFHRWRDGQIPEGCKIIGAARAEMSRADFIATVEEHYRTFFPEEKNGADDWKAFAEHLHYCALDVASQDADWRALEDLLAGGEDKIRLFYLALPPGLFGPVSANIGARGLNTPQARIVLEKPIGHDLNSAREINDAVGKVFPEKSIFRIDHYLGKETVQNLLILRFTNSLFEPVWNANVVDHIQITVAETVGAGKRASYYDTSGALRDMVQNHMLQLLCLVAMEPPNDFGADTIRDEKIKVLRALKPITPKTATRDTVRGQYRDGAISGTAVPGYADELGKPSDTETFTALKVHVDNWRWSGVPFYLRTGKRMKERRSEIVIQFKRVAHALTPPEAGHLHPTRLVIRLQPDEGVKLLLMTKDPGPGGMRLRYVPLNLSYADTFCARYPDAYERVLMAVVRNDLGLFMRRDEVEAAWKWIDGILSAWNTDAMPCQPYAAGTDGPTQGAMLIDRDNREWFDGL